MSIYAIGDLHFGTKVNKPMDIFGKNGFNMRRKLVKIGVK